LKNISISVLLFGAAALLMGAAPRAQNAKPSSTIWKTPWTYEGAKGAGHWGDLDPDYATCKEGKAQSPIDIRNAVKADLPALRFEYRTGPLNIINNGYTAVRIDYVQSGDFLFVGDKRYELTQFHFHHPSEEKIHGKQYDMVLHLMHKGDDGKVLGVAVMVNAGAANSTVATLWKYMPQTAGGVQQIPGVEIDPATLLPASTGYYTYEGSQTAPPCTEGVTWIVLKTPITVSPEQIAAFAKLYPHDVRPVQPLNGREVKESQ
jgi:carbonic anhydrase